MKDGYETENVELIEEQIIEIKKKRKFVNKSNIIDRNKLIAEKFVKYKQAQIFLSSRFATENHIDANERYKQIREKRSNQKIERNMRHEQILEEKEATIEYVLNKSCNYLKWYTWVYLIKTTAKLADLYNHLENEIPKQRLRNKRDSNIRRLQGIFSIKMKFNST